MKQYIFNGSIRTLVSQWLADTGFAQTEENVERVSASLDRQPFMPTSLYVGSLVELPETYTVEDLEAVEKTSGTPTTTTRVDTQEETSGTPTSTYYNAGTQQNEPMNIVDRTSSTPKVTTTTRPYTRQNDTMDTVKNG